VQVMEARGTRVEQPEAFDALFFGHAARMVRLARLLGDDDPEDVVQESFCKLYAARDRLQQDERKVLGYLHRTVVNEVRSRHRHRQVVRRDAHLFRPDDAHDPTGSHDDRAAVQQALAALPPRQREALVLRYWMDLPLAEIAEVMGVRLGTVKSQVSRALDVLGSLLREEVGR
jgi:RNA polymerase sigma-70 factor (sigma-E family)